MNIGRIHMILFSSFFFLLLLVPSLSKLFLYSPVINCENRTLTPFPVFNFHDSILKTFGQYYEENYGLRGEFMQFQAIVKNTFFHSSSNPKDVQIGTNNWLFPTSKADNSYESYTNLNLFTPSELETFRVTHVSRKKLLQKRNCAYILAVWPNKATIYPEFVPRHIKWMVKDTISKVDQVINYFKICKSEIQIIFPKNYLLQYKKEQLYFKNDTHWNELGAFYGYFYFMSKTKSVFNECPLSKNSFSVTYDNLNTGDLLGMMGICNSNIFTEKAPRIRLSFTSKVFSLPNDASYKHINYSTKNRQKVLFFRDSYTRGLIPYVVQHFRESYFYWQDYNQKIVDSLRPDVVVVSKVERYF